MRYTHGLKIIRRRKHAVKISLVITGILIILILVLVLMILALFFQSSSPHIISETYKQTSKNSASPAASLKHASASATPAPTPTSIVYSGFCQNVPILFYHHIQPMDQAKTKNQQSLSVDDKFFDSQMSYLASHGYQTISVDQLVQSILSKKRLGPKSIVITLDDGYQDVYTYAYPILVKYHLIGNLMIPTGLLGNPDYMSWDELKRMVDSGLIFAYDHTWSHANLVALSSEKAKNEVLTAKQQLEERLGIKVNIFAYPYGAADSRTVNILRANGFIAALSTIPGTVQCDSFIMSLHRSRIGNSSLRNYGF